MYISSMTLVVVKIFSQRKCPLFKQLQLNIDCGCRLRFVGTSGEFVL